MPSVLVQKARLFMKPQFTRFGVCCCACSKARRLMLGENLDAASAGVRVGYDDPSYFSREYKRPFGAPPQRDITRLRDNLHA